MAFQIKSTNYSMHLWKNHGLLSNNQTNTDFSDFLKQNSSMIHQCIQNGVPFKKYQFVPCLENTDQKKKFTNTPITLMENIYYKRFSFFFLSDIGPEI